MVFSHETVIKLPSSAIHLDDWLFNLSEQDYQAAAKAHRAVGTGKGSEFLGMVNVESIGGNLLIQHYKTELLEPLHVRLLSPRSRGYLLHLVPFHPWVRWEMEAFPLSETESRFRCTVEVRLSYLVRMGGFFIGANHSIHRHLVEETYGFARDIEKKGEGKA